MPDEKSRADDQLGAEEEMRDLLHSKGPGKSPPPSERVGIATAPIGPKSKLWTPDDNERTA